MGNQEARHPYRSRRYNGLANQSHHLLRHAPQIQKSRLYARKREVGHSIYIYDAKLTNELYTEVDVNNIASQKVLERCGYKVREKQKLGYLYCYQNYNTELQTS